MPKRKKSLAKSVTGAGKKLLATDTAQNFVGTIADKMQEIAVENADDVSAKVKQKAAKAAGRKAPSSKKASRKASTSRPAGKASTTKPSSAKASTSKKKSTREKKASKK